MKTSVKKSEKTIAIANLTNGNKEAKSLSGVIKVVNAFWSKGYKEAFNFVGINKVAELTVDLITKGLHTTCYIDGKVVKVVKVAKKDEKDNYLTTTKNGKVCKVYEEAKKVVDKWTPNILWGVLYASKLANEAEATKEAPIPTGKTAPQGLGKHTPKNTKKEQPLKKVS